MGRQRIVCINKAPSHQDPNHHITHVGVGNPQGWENRLRVEEVIRQLRLPTGDRYYVRGSDGSEAEVRLGKCPFCAHAHTFIRTTADHSRADNLLSLFECV
jgi:uncharacterized protein DUF3892